ncbi:MAG: TDP-4-oxo-6-deoxy-alpha-D-glucose-3,4-oxoisomerase [Verrucomicrobia subdivision 3 bacterium]|nr:TDP-4-oxo-6-deoxy-alpha-D-glucose-3,4-oxoisomerase [Limisphaerales bacterium]MCS1415846.1 TDP-4-oxo-6-deoxy-alpha-D-glucose-3,4-oxoisomerase [Limisphaerales bacterium]
MSNKTTSYNGYSSIDSCKLIDLPRITDHRGNITFIESERHLPFSVRRVFYLYDVPGDAARGEHAHKECHQLLIAVSGSFDVIIDDGANKKRVHLARSYYGLYLPPMVWLETDNFSSGSVCLVLASEYYNEDDYYREYSTYQLAVTAAREGSVY